MRLQRPTMSQSPGTANAREITTSTSRSGRSQRGNLRAEKPLAASLRYEVPTSLAYDPSGRLWVAWGRRANEGWAEGIWAAPMKTTGIKL
ncbi:MAG: hypothetical protein IPJ07_26970 [Acidobacteria bacterium]|nr:hypothetical protein [Acidobacteriota bacterium]